MKKGFLIIIFAILIILNTFLILALEKNTDHNLKINKTTIESINLKNKERVVVIFNEDKSSSFTKLNLVPETLLKDIKKENIKQVFKNKVSIEINKTELGLLLNNDQIKEIKPEIRVKALLYDTANITNASTSWSIVYHGYNLTGIDETVCIIDTGVNFSHPDLRNKNKTCVIDCVGKPCVENCSIGDDNGHGTHVAGIVGANGTLKGISPGTKIIGVKVLSASGSGSGTDVEAGIQWCINNYNSYNISVISMSLGVVDGQGNEVPYNYYCDSEYSGDLTLWVNDAVLKNISMIIATGNNLGAGNITAPACIKNATAVGGVDKNDNFYFNRNNLTDLIAPGVSIYSTKNTGGYMLDSGTSMAAPHVSAAYTIIRQFFRLQYNRNPTVFEIENILKNSSVQINDTAGTRINYSRINVYNSLVYMDNSVPEVSLTTPLNNCGSSNLTFQCNAKDIKILNVTFMIWNSSGIYNNSQTIAVNNSNSYLTFNLTNLPYGTYYWNCLATDHKNNYSYAANNYTITNLTCLEENIVFNITPYVMSINESFEIIRFVTNISTNVTIEYGLNSSYGNSLENSSFSTSKELVISNLSPDTRYYYRVKSINMTNSFCFQNSSFNSSFKTSSNQKTSFSFALIGDSNGNSCGEIAGNFSYIIENLSSKEIDFVIITGDNIEALSGGCTNHDSYWQTFHAIVSNLRKRISFISTPGDHENLSNDVSARNSWKNYWILPINGNGTNGEWNETSYYWRYANSLFISLNTLESENSHNISGNQYDWLTDTLNQSGYIHKFVFTHSPLLGSNKSGLLPVTNPFWSNYLDDLMYNDKVSAVFYGHENYYCYNTTKNNTMLHIISGGAGGALDPITRCLGIGFSQYHYIIINVSNNILNASVYNLSGNIIHNFSRIMDSIPTRISSVQASSVTSSSAIISWATDHLSNSSVNYGSTQGLGFYSGENILTTNHTINLNSLSSDTTYYYNISSCDNYNNCVINGSYNFTTLESSSTNTNSGGTSGGGSASFKTYSLSSDQFINGYSKEIKKNDRIKFNLDTSDHYVIINNINENSVNLTIKSNPINIIMRENETRKINITSSSYYDLEIKINSIKNTLVNISIKNIFEKIELKNSLENNNLSDFSKVSDNVTVENYENNSLEKKSDIKKQNKIIKWQYILITWIIAILILLIIKNYLKNETIKTFS
jgi:subtilisin family serine protease